MARVVRHANQWAPLHKRARALSPQLAQALRNAFEEIRGKLSINGLALAIANKDQREARRIIKSLNVRASIEKAFKVEREAYFAGAAIGLKVAAAANRAAAKKARK